MCIHSGTSINGHLINVVTYCTVMRPVLLVPNAHRTDIIYCFVHKAVTSIICTTATQSRPQRQFSIQNQTLLIRPALYKQLQERPWTFRLHFLQSFRLQVLILKHYTWKRLSYSHVNDREGTPWQGSDPDRETECGLATWPIHTQPLLPTRGAIPSVHIAS